ncbi:uncharacterized protein LOC135837282 [Planococcus citri]|uniref:uncharacterized protein LOC135837282 n=1 Tax=Planococcus citri TaxID=170843 RepID=UPI0031F86DF4
MNSTKNIIFFVLFALKEFTSGIETNSGEENETDITIPLNEAIIKTFHSVHPTSTMNLVSYMESRDSDFDLPLGTRIAPFTKNIFCHHINVSIWEPLSSPQIYCEFPKNKTHLFNDELIFKVLGFMDTSPGRTHASFKTHAKFRDIVITGTKTSKRFQVHIVHNHISNYVTVPWSRTEIPRNTLAKLIKKIRSGIPSMIHDNVNSNEKFLHAFSSSFCHNPKQNITLAYPDFPLNEQKYYYFIPTVSFVGIDLVDIKIKGLSNFETLKPNTTFGKSAYTLIVKNICGTMKLDNTEFNNFKFYEMDFSIDNLYITADFETKRLVVEARDYNVTHVSSMSSRPPKASIFSELIMKNIERAIGSQLMPSLEVPETNKLDDTSTPSHLESAPPVSQVATETSPKSDSKSYSTKSPIPLTQGWYTELTSADKELYHGRLFKKTSPPHRPLFQKKVELTSPKTDRPSSTTTTRVTTQTSKLEVKTSTAIQKTDPSQSQHVILTLASRRSNNKKIYETSPSDSTIRSTLSSTIAGKTSRSLSTRGTKISARQTPKPDSPEVGETAIESAADEEDDGYEYDIVFHNVSIKLVPGTPYPKQIQCGFANSIKINHQVKAIPSGDIHLSNKGNSINIRFHVNFTSIKISVMKPNNSKENESCEFQIHNNQDIKVAVPSNKNTSKSNTDLLIKKKIDNTLMSMMTERISQHLKPLVCLPFDICSQSLQMVDQFFGNFVDNVLNKCSLRRDTNTTIST